MKPRQDTSAFGKFRQRLPSMALLAVASCTLGMNLLTTLFNFYYVKVFMNRYNITNSWLNIAQTFFMIANFIVGPFLAYAQDFGPPAFRNRRRLVLFVGPAFALVFALPWFPWYPINDPVNAHPWLPGVHLMLVLFLWNICFNLVSACASGLFAELSTDESSRVKALFANQIAASLAAAAVFPVDALSKSTNDFVAFQICCGVVGLIAMASFIFTGLKASDVVAQVGCERSEAAGAEKKTSIRKLSFSKQEIAALEAASKDPPKPPRCAALLAYLSIVGQVLKTRNFWCAIVANLMTFFRVCVTHNFTAVYTEGLIDENVFPTGSVLIAAYFLACQVTPRIVFILVCPVIRWFGSYRTLMLTLILVWVNSAVGVFLGTFVGYNYLAGTLLIESILVAFQDMFVIIYSEVIDDDVKRYNRKMPVSTILFTLVSLFVQPATALAPMIVVQALNVGDYQKYKDQIRNAPAYTKQVMFLVSTCVPAVSSLISFIAMYFYKRPRPERIRGPAPTRL